MNDTFTIIGEPYPPAAGDMRLWTRRDEFAKAAMQGWLATYPAEAEAHNAEAGAHVVAKLAYVIADAMMKAREVRNETT